METEQEVKGRFFFNIDVKWMREREKLPVIEQN